MRISRRNSAFALAITLVLMALIVVVVVAYLANTRTDRSTSSLYANRIRARILAEDGLAAASKLLADNTRYGNYITAMPAPSPSPAGLYTEVYRPTDSTNTTVAISNAYLQLNNAGGDILVSRAVPAVSPAPQVDPRPTPQMVPSPLPSASPFSIPSPIPALVQEILPPRVSPTPFGNSYNFNQVVRVGLNASGRLIQPSPTPAPPSALGQWVNVRDSTGALLGRYAFFIEDESMKLNINATGNASPTPRPTDLSPGPFVASQVQEIDPAGVLPANANRTAADTKLMAIGAAGSRFSTKATVALIDPSPSPSQWQANFPSYAHLATVMSQDDLTTARGWKRLDINGLVTAAGDNASKVLLAQRLANWIRDAWTGLTPINDLQPFQMFKDERIRLQIAANIIDYIDADNIPTDLGDFPNIGDPSPDPITGYPIIGIEKLPYITEVDVTYTSTVTTAGTPNVADSGHADIAVKFRINFQNLFEQDMLLKDSIAKIRLKGIPAIDKLASTNPIFDHSTDDWFEIPVDVAIAGDPILPINGTVPWGGDNVANGVAGVASFTTNTFLTESVTYTPSDPASTSTGVIATFESGLLQVEVIGKTGERLDRTTISLSSRAAKWENATGSPQLDHDFLEKSKSASSVNAHYGRFPSGATLSFGDPRYRPTPITSRWYTVTRTDDGRLAVTQNLAELDCRAYSIDWYDYVGDRPLLYHRNAPMVSVGELGNVSACEYPWRTIYLQYAGRSQNTTDTDITPYIQDRRGSSAGAASNPALLPKDYMLIDLFKTTASDNRDGSLNINSQFNVPASPTPVPTATPVIDQGAFVSLFTNVPVGGGVPGVPPVPGSTPNALSVAAVKTLSTIIGGRRSAVVALATGGPGPPGGAPPVDNTPRRPYFTIGEIASDISWLINQSANSTMTGNSRTRTTTNYSLLRPTPTSSTWYRNYGTDMQVEEPFRKISSSITTRGNVFRVLYVGQAIKDLNGNGIVDALQEVQTEYMGEAFIQRQASYAPEGSNPDAMKTSDSTYKVIANRVVTQ